MVCLCVFSEKVASEVDGLGVFDRLCFHHALWCVSVLLYNLNFTSTNGWLTDTVWWRHKASALHWTFFFFDDDVIAFLCGTKSSGILLLSLLKFFVFSVFYRFRWAYGIVLWEIETFGNYEYCVIIILVIPNWQWLDVEQRFQIQCRILSARGIECASPSNAKLDRTRNLIERLDAPNSIEPPTVASKEIVKTSV